MPAGIPERGWTKLTTFEADLHGLRGSALFLDLDVVIVDDITPFFEQPGEFLIIHDWKRPWRITGNSSVYRFELGAHPEVLDRFAKLALEPGGGSPADLTRLEQSFAARWQPVVKPTGFRGD